MRKKVAKSYLRRQCRITKMDFGHKLDQRIIKTQLPVIREYQDPSGNHNSRRRTVSGYVVTDGRTHLRNCLLMMMPQQKSKVKNNGACNDFWLPPSYKYPSSTLLSL